MGPNLHDFVKACIGMALAFSSCIYYMILECDIPFLTCSPSPFDLLRLAPVSSRLVHALSLDAYPFVFTVQCPQSGRRQGQWLLPRG